MENNSENLKFKTPPAHLKSKFLKIHLIKLDIAKQYLSKERFIEVFHKAISEGRVIING
jgi:hypothetical protein